jgi:hypothetical protein
MNAFVKSFQHDNVTVIDIESLFTMGDGSIRTTNDDGILLYQDGNHLSDAGADLVKADVVRAIREMASGS